MIYRRSRRTGRRPAGTLRLTIVLAAFGVAAVLGGWAGTWTTHRAAEDSAALLVLAVTRAGDVLAARRAP